MTRNESGLALSCALCLTVVLSSCVPLPLPAERERMPIDDLAQELEKEAKPDSSSPHESSPPSLSTRPSTTARKESWSAESGELKLARVLESVEQHLPELLAAEQEIERAEGELLAARGGFDTTLRGKARLDAQGFYESERADLELEQPLSVWGTSLFSGYRIGRGDFAVYDGKSKTNEDGEVRVGARVPLLQGRAIDKRRLAFWKARIVRDRADPLVSMKRLAAMEKATLAYWKWRAAGEKLRVVRQILAIARTRQAWLTESVAEGLLPEISLVDNERLVVEREALEISSIRAFEKAAFKLSLYLRDRDGNPVRASAEALGEGFPDAPTPNLEDDEINLAIARALSERPEVQQLELDFEAARLDTAYYENRRLPKLNLEVFASQDLGSASSSSRDKDPWELGAGLSLEIPFLMRGARGKTQAAKAKVLKIQQELRWVRDQIEARVRDTASALSRAYERIAAARRAVDLALRMERAERDQLEAGNSDLLRVNLREDKRAKSMSVWIEAQADYFAALAAFRTAVALSPATLSPEISKFRQNSRAGR